MDQKRGILFDLDGVFYVSNQAIDGGQKLINSLRNKSIPFRFLTNTTTKTRREIREKLGSFGLLIDEKEIFSAAYIGINYLRSIGSPPCHLLIHDNIYSDYSEFDVHDRKPEFVVIGDRGNKWNYDDLNKAFRYLMEGAGLIALHKGRYFQTLQGLEIDIGAIITGLEYSSGQTAISLGKPNPKFFQTALEDISIGSGKAIMVGDDLINDIGGAQRTGMKGVLVRTGKFRKSDLSHSHVKPDFIIESINELEDILSLI